MPWDSKVAHSVPRVRRADHRVDSALVAPDRLGRLQGVEAIEAEAAQDTRHGCLRHAAVLCDLRAGPARRRSTSIRVTTAAGVGRRKRCGRDERSRRPATPST